MNTAKICILADNSFDFKRIVRDMQDSGLALHELDGFECVRKGDWEVNFKDYCCMTDVVKHEPSGRFIEITYNRSGSYYSDYEYSEPNLREVKPVNKMVVEYDAA